MYIDLEERLDRMINLVECSQRYGFQYVGPGIKPWSHRHENGNKAIELRGSDWTYYEDDKEIMTGFAAGELCDFLEDWEAYNDFRTNLRTQSI